MSKINARKRLPLSDSWNDTKYVIWKLDFDKTWCRWSVHHPFSMFRYCCFFSYRSFNYFKLDIQSDMLKSLLSPHLLWKRGTLKLIRPSVSLSICHKNFNLAQIFWSINDRALIFGMHDPCDKPFLLIPCGDLDLWPITMSNLLPGGGPQFFEFACIKI